MEIPCDCGNKIEKGRKTCWTCRHPNYGGTMATRQAFISKLDRFTCSQCGWGGMCDIHHTDQDHSNGMKDNLQVLCPNCHRKIHHPITQNIIGGNND